MSETRGVLLVGHGTRDNVGTEEFFRLSDRLAERLQGASLVRPCLLEFQQPDIAAAWDSLMQCGCHEVTVAPLLLFSAGHAKSDIPGEVESARASSAGGESVCVRFAKPITRHAAMINAARVRLRQTITGGPLADPERTAIVMVGRGSRDVCASSDMRVLTEVVVAGRVEGRSIADEFSISRTGLQTTFYAMAEPRLPVTLDEVAGSGRFDRVIVQPHLLFAGRLYEAIERQVADANAKFPNVRFDVSDYLGPTDLIAAALAARIESAV
ncbi:sirohydrochlorin cobaltochelatase [Rhodopirellula rubra]|uniref:Sirohydrochlorin cobaltochelatase n=1 Tax=Aporhodopirellula rubra TaxID=980271 RepID=A0A7W5H710_9BACT|nr:sirohydrochlorin chelatase [Aporhodopirellula rubra]MBB3207456.1 sirohydrochlorin cobaltochelatase [Aporhodopirellula rubra]